MASLGHTARGKFGTEFEGCKVAMGVPSLGGLRLYVGAELLRGGDLNLRSEFDGGINAEARGLNLKRKRSDNANESVLQNLKFSRSGAESE